MFEDLLRRLAGGDAGDTRVGAPHDHGEPDEVRTLCVRYRNEAGQETTAPAVKAEVRRKAAFGFGPRRDRLQVRLQLPAGGDLLSPAGMSLLEGDRLFGP